MSATTEAPYTSVSELEAAEANGYAVVVIMQRVTPSTGEATTFARTTGPFVYKESAHSKASRLRRQFREAIAREAVGAAPGSPQTFLISVSVEPLWKELNP